jgi:hypothetical protein
MYPSVLGHCKGFGIGLISLELFDLRPIWKYWIGANQITGYMQTCPAFFSIVGFAESLAININDLCLYFGYGSLHSI